MYSGLIQARPKDRTGPLGQVLRALAKKQRKTAGFRQMPARIKDRKLAVRRVRCRHGCAWAGAFVGSYRLDRSPECHQQGTLDIDILLDIQTTSTRRRIEMEINSASTICAGSGFALGSKNGDLFGCGCREPFPTLRRTKRWNWCLGPASNCGAMRAIRNGNDTSACRSA